MTRSESMKIGRRQHRRMLRAGIAYQEDGQPQVGAGCARNVGNHTALAIRLCTSPAPRRSQILNYGTFGTVSAGTGCTATTGFEALQCRCPSARASARTKSCPLSARAAWPRSTKPAILGLDWTVAIKVLPAQLASDPQFRDRFDREGRAISALDHPHICGVYDVGEQDGTSFLVMLYLEGEMLQNRSSDARRDVRDGSWNCPSCLEQRRSCWPS